MKREAEMVNLVFSDSANGILMHKRELFRIDKNSLCSIELYLHGGDISLPFDVKKRKDFYETGYCKRHCCTVQSQIKKFSKMLKSDGEICIWFSRKCVDEYLGMLWTVYNYKNYAKNIFLCDCTELVDAIAYFLILKFRHRRLKIDISSHIMILNKYRNIGRGFVMRIPDCEFSKAVIRYLSL